MQKNNSVSKIKKSESLESKFSVNKNPLPTFEYEDLKNIKIVGTSYYNGYKILSNVVRDQGEGWNVGGYRTHKLELLLVPEPSNKYDANAIRVDSAYETPSKARISRSGTIGHVPKDIAKIIKIDKPEKIKVKVREGFKNMSIFMDLSKFI